MAEVQYTTLTLVELQARASKGDRKALEELRGRSFMERTQFGKDGPADPMYKGADKALKAAEAAAAPAKLKQRMEDEGSTIEDALARAAGGDEYAIKELRFRIQNDALDAKELSAATKALAEAGAGNTPLSVSEAEAKIDEEKKRKDGDPSDLAASLLNSKAQPWQENQTPEQNEQFRQAWKKAYGQFPEDDHRSSDAQRINAIKSAAVQFEVRYDTQTGEEDAPDPKSGKLLGNVRALGDVVRTMSGRLRTARVPQVHHDSALQADGRSAGVLNDIIAEADQAGVPWQVLWGTLRAKSGFSANRKVTNPDGTVTVGIAGITARPGSTEEAKALDTGHAIRHAAQALKANFSAYKDWGLASLAFHRPQSAVHIFRDAYGNSQQDWEYHDKDYISKAFKGLDQIGFSGDDARIDLIGANDQGGMGRRGRAGPDPVSVEFTDPATIREEAVRRYRELLFRDPTEKEIASMTAVIHGLNRRQAEQVAQVRTAQFNQANPQDGSSNAFQQTARTSAFTTFNGQQVFHPLPSGESAKVAPSGGGLFDKAVDYVKQAPRATLVAPRGAPVQTAVRGKVKFAGKKGGYGNLVIVVGEDGREYLYAHLGSMNVAVGDDVDAGVPLGTVGSSGTANGPHLRFEIHEGGRAVDPEPMLSAALTGDVPVPSVPPGTSVSGQVVGAPIVGEVTNFDPTARLARTIKDTAEYEELYRKKPTGMDEASYAGQFSGEADYLLGTQAGAQGYDAVRAGMRAGDTGLTASRIIHDPNSSKTRSFRQRMFEASQLFDEML